MRLTFLGTGTSGGVPVLGCNCEVCRSHDARDRRMRAAALLETENTRILIDAGPDIRLQLMPLPFRRIDAVLLTHIHYDHVAGIDDLRPYCIFGPIDIFADNRTVAGLHQTMPYCFAPNLYPGVPLLNLCSIAPHRQFRIGDVEVLPFQVMHDKMPILGYRFGDFAYITDMKTIDDAEMAYLRGVKMLVVNALRWEKPHHSHMLVDEAVAFARRVGAGNTYLTHLTHKIGCHAEASQKLPAGIHLAYDSLQINI